MDYKDIVNRDLYNLKNCDEEPIHIPGSIQPHGFLLAADKESGIINFCSGNIAEYMPVTYAQVLGKSLGDVFGNPFAETVNESIGTQAQRRHLLQHDFNGTNYMLTVHYSNNHIIIEGEPTVTEKENDLYTSSKQLLGYIEDSYTLKQLCHAVAGTIKDITGYDRVMIYRFDAEYNGEVIAEGKEEHLESFLGLHYPHTDIPVQARELYIKNQLRIISDVAYEAVPIYTIGAADNSSLDLSMSVLRSVSPIHLQYLANMGVSATLTISLLHKGRLWGLIACHHYSPKYLSGSVRLSAKLQGHFITSQIDMRLQNEEYEMMKKASVAADAITSAPLPLNFESLDSITGNDHILNLCNASGVSILVNGRIYTHGTVPEADEIMALAEYLEEYTECKSLYTDALAAISIELNRVSRKFPGIVYMCFGFNNPDCIIWYREETVKEVKWAGDPVKTIEKDSNGLSPRKSFSLWKETVKGKSRPWEEFELNVARNFFSFLQNHLRTVVLNNEHEKQKKITRILEETNAELENINWISTHDLQEPLRKIRIMSSMILSEDQLQAPAHIYSLVNKMNASAERMQIFIHDILSYTKINTANVLETVNLEDVIRQVEQDLQDSLEEKKATIAVKKLPLVNGIPFLLRQLFSNLINNSLKFSSPERNIRIEISAEQTAAAIIIKYTDNGIGFDAAYKEKIFEVFSRLHTKEQYTGSGIGLALCKKVMARHQGTIRAEGKKEEGAVFYMHFPAV